MTARLRITAYGIAVAWIAVVGTLWLPGPPVDFPLLVAVLVGGTAVAVAIRLTPFSRQWDYVGGAFAAAVIALVVAATGGAASPYDDLYLLLLLFTGLQLPGYMLAVNTGVVVVASGTELLYSDIPPAFYSDFVADLALWIAGALIVYQQAERQRRQQAEIAYLSDLKSSFLRATHHELRTPFTVMRGSIETLARRHDQLGPDARARILDALQRNTARLDDLLADLLAFDQANRGTAPVRRRDVDVAALARQIVDDLDGDGRVAVEVEPLSAEIDVPKAERIVAVLVQNALEHSGPGVPVWVAITGRDDVLTITVDDAGPGVPEDVRQRIFAPLTQGPDEATSASPGMGMGLALALRYAELHGGGIEVSDRPGGGARFVVRLPATLRRGEPDAP